MPIVTLEIVADADRELDPNLAQSLADVGRALNSPPGQAWIRVRSLGRDQYAENASLVAADGLPVFVTVLKQRLPIAAELHAEVAKLSSAIAQVVGRSVSCVHVEYAPAASGRVSFGGKLVR